MADFVLSSSNYANDTVLAVWSLTVCDRRRLTTNKMVVKYILFILTVTGVLD